MLGTLRLPLMILLASTPASAAGTNIGVSAASAAAGSVRHAREGRVSWPVVWWMLPPSVIGAFLGGYFGSDLPDAALLGVAAGILVFNGLDLLLRPFDAKPRTRLRIAPAVLGGLGVGALGGAIGVILGTMRMPVLLRGVGMTAARAVGTNLVVGFAVGSVGVAPQSGPRAVECNHHDRCAPAGVKCGGTKPGAHDAGRGAEDSGRQRRDPDD